MLLNLILSNLSISLLDVISSQDYRYIYYTHIYLKTLFTNKCDLQVHDTPKTWKLRTKKLVHLYMCDAS